MDVETIRRYAAPVPRYTSYPTAVQFSPRVQPLTYVDWLGALPADARLSLYVHIPFCQELCWYCACATKAVRRYEPVASYLPALETEIGNVGALVPRGHKVTAIHWGGGSPSILVAADIARLADRLRGAFSLSDKTEFAVEVDPRGVTDEQVKAFARAGLTRVSLGVQDFDEAVQLAINRIQSFEMTRAVVARFRDAGARSLNIDLVYGLPRQTLASLGRTIGKVVGLRPDRIAVFGYAHVPERAKQQRLMDPATMPGIQERFEQRARIAELLTAAGYIQVGIDHYALPADGLAHQPLRRNFQGYTTDACDATLGLGATAIGQLPGGYVQNAAPTHDYVRRITDRGLATARGIALSTDDRMRAYVIERLMCGFDFSGSALRQRFGAAASSLCAEASALAAGDRDALIEPTADGFRCTERGRIFVRAICARFDAYWGAGSARHALAV